jgi:hypothetical protein
MTDTEKRGPDTWTSRTPMSKQEKLEEIRRMREWLQTGNRETR